MAMTRYQLERRLVAPTRLKGVLSELGLNVTADPEAPNDDLNDPIATALEAFGITPADPGAVVDADLAGVPDALAGRFVDLAEIRALEGFITWLTARPRAERFPNYSVDRPGLSGEWLISLLKIKQARYDALHGDNGPVAVKMHRGIRHNLKMIRHDRRNRHHTAFDD